MRRARAPAGGVSKTAEGRPTDVTADPALEQALVLSETALTAAQQAVEQAQIAEKAANQSTRLAREALAAAERAHEDASRRASGAR